MIVLDYQDRRPLYEQVEEKFRNLILMGVLEPGSRMPLCGSWPWNYRSTPTPSSGPMSPWSRRAISTRWRARLLRRPPGRRECSQKGPPAPGIDASAAELLFLGMTAGELAGRRGGGGPADCERGAQL